ncbi:hypothetical protein FRB98_004513 [Tulasnella sp. 332]|nr:hypothetical protein FRB98_004513 [Tulasnella sp. 332]
MLDVTTPVEDHNQNVIGLRLERVSSVPTNPARRNPNESDETNTRDRDVARGRGAAHPDSRDSSVATTAYDPPRASTADSISTAGARTFFRQRAPPTPQPSSSSRRTTHQSQKEDTPRQQQHVETASNAQNQVPVRTSSHPHLRRDSSNSSFKAMDATMTSIILRPPARNQAMFDVDVDMEEDLVVPVPLAAPVAANPRRRSRAVYSGSPVVAGQWGGDGGDMSVGPSPKRAKVEHEEVARLFPAVILVPGSDSYSQEHHDCRRSANNTSDPAATAEYNYRHAPPTGDVFYSQDQQQQQNRMPTRLMEEVNADFELYLEQQHQKAEGLRTKWATCTMVEWHEGGEDSLVRPHVDIIARFSALVTFVGNGMISKKTKLDDMQSRIDQHSETLDERDRLLASEKDVLIKETGRVVAK